jgi:curved DNA-binding protein
MEFKDYYKTLGVDRDASEADLKKAFRKLARQYHPDHAARDNPDAEAKFKEINEAYEVLSDPEKRRKYDTLGANWQQAGAGRSAHPAGGMPEGWEEVFAGSGARGGSGGFSFNFGGTGFSDFFEAFFGGLGGQGTRAGVDPSEFGNGFGGAVHEQRPPALDVQADLLVTLEEANNGAQRTLTLRKTGTDSPAEATETIKVRVPAGIRQGQKIRVPGKGRGDNRGRRGDLFLRVRLERHPDFRVEGADLYHDLEIHPWEAALGCKKTVPTLAQRVSVTIPPGTSSGRKFRLKGLGMKKTDGSRGDLYAVIQVHIPAATTDAQRAAWDALRDSLGH